MNSLAIMLAQCNCLPFDSNVLMSRLILWCQDTAMAALHGFRTLSLSADSFLVVLVAVGGCMGMCWRLTVFAPDDCSEVCAPSWKGLCVENARLGHVLSMPSAEGNMHGHILGAPIHCCLHSAWGCKQGHKQGWGDRAPTKCVVCCRWGAGFSLCTVLVLTSSSQHSVLVRGQWWFCMHIL